MNLNNQTIIIQLATWEQVRASICYMPYWIYAALRAAGHVPALHEDCTFDNACDVIDNAPMGANIFVDVSSAPQVEAARELSRHYKASMRTLHFVGYGPFAPGLNFLKPNELPVDILTGVWKFHEQLGAFRRGYATIDSHVKCHDARPFLPVFMSLGCTRNCPYCYVSGPWYGKGVRPLAECLRVIDEAIEMKVNLHFEDENFYAHPHFNDIIRHLDGKGLMWIALADSISVSKALESGVTVGQLENAGHWLTEIGLEAVSPEVLNKKQSMGEILASGLKTFWLSVSLFPMETISTLNMSGDFYRDHGMAWDDLLPRLRTQSSVGGLGQFYQPYPMTNGYEAALGHGRMLPGTPLRLRPSYVGNAFDSCIPVQNRLYTEDEHKWVNLYGSMSQGTDLLEACDGDWTVRDLCGDNHTAYALMAQAAKLGIITDAKDTK